MLIVFVVAVCLAQMTQVERAWHHWFDASCVQHGLAGASEARTLDASVQFDLVELSFWIADNDLQTWDHLRSAPAPAVWPGVEKFSAEALEKVERLQKRRCSFAVQHGVCVQ